MDDDVVLSVRDDVGVVTLNRPESLNAWDMKMQGKVLESVSTLEANDEVSGLVITGAGDRAFCAGQDLHETAEFEAENVDAWLDNFAALYDEILGCTKPVVAALNGVAAGSGYQLALVCDVRVAHAGVRIGQPEVSSGIPSVTGLALTWLSLGHSRTTELMLSGRLMQAEEARRVGILHRIVPQEEVLTAALRTAQELAAQPRLAFRLTKQRIHDQIRPILQAAFETARTTDRQAWSSQEPQRVAAEFFEQRRNRKAQ